MKFTPKFLLGILCLFFCISLDACAPQFFNGHEADGDYIHELRHKVAESPHRFLKNAEGSVIGLTNCFESQRFICKLLTGKTPPWVDSIPKDENNYHGNLANLLDEDSKNKAVQQLWRHSTPEHLLLPIHCDGTEHALSIEKRTTHQGTWYRPHHSWWLEFSYQDWISEDETLWNKNYARKDQKESYREHGKGKKLSKDEMRNFLSKYERRFDRYSMCVYAVDPTINLLQSRNPRTTSALTSPPAIRSSSLKDNKKQATKKVKKIILGATFGLIAAYVGARILLHHK